MWRLQLKNAKAGQVRFRADKNGIIHGGIGSLALMPPHLKENLEALMARFRESQAGFCKGHLCQEDYVSSTMGPGLIIDQGSLGVRTDKKTLGSAADIMLARAVKDRRFPRGFNELLAAVCH